MYQDTSPTFQINKKSESGPSPLPLARFPLTFRKRQRYRMRSSDHESMRYQCICSMQYFSYSALYQHMKKHHKQFLLKNKHFAANNSIQTVDPKHGFRIRKILLEKIQFKSQEDLRKQQLRGQELRKIRLNERQIEQKLKAQYKQKNVIARQRLSEINFENQQIDRRIKLVKQKLSKTQQMSGQMQGIIQAYEKILKVLKISEIVKYFKNNSNADEESQQF